MVISIYSLNWRDNNLLLTGHYKSCSPSSHGSNKYVIKYHRIKVGFTKKFLHILLSIFIFLGHKKGRLNFGWTSWRFRIFILAIKFW